MTAKRPEGRDISAQARPAPWGAVVRVGGLNVQPVSDGIFVARPSYFGTHVPSGARPEMFPHDGAAWLPIGCFLIRGSDRVLLVDGGLGPHDKQLPGGMRLTGGWLPGELRRAGITPEEVTDVVCTHLHSDHVGWLFDINATRVFTRATIWFGAADWDHFVTGAGEMDDHIRQGLLATPAPRLHPIDADTTIAPGVTAVPTPGHTPGHLCLVLTSGGRSIWLVGDAITCPIQLAEPTWHSFGDVEPDAAEHARQYLWHELARPHTVGTGAHFPGLQLGQVRGDQGWCPVT